MKVYLGIDPGSRGSLCALYEDSTIEFMDYTENTHLLSAWLHNIRNRHTIRMCMTEDVHSIFGVSAKSNFNFGFNVGILHGMFRTMLLPLDTIQPKAWQKHIGITAKGKDIKKEVASICTRLYPSCDIFGPKGGLLDGRSDSLLIATYCRYKHP